MVNYLKRINSSFFQDSIRKTAIESLKFLKRDLLSWKEAKLRKKRPLDYLRSAEFPIVLENLELKDGFRILDIGSPQWFTLLLAKIHPSIEFFYLNILKREIDCVKEIAKGLGIKNLHFVQGDVRSMGFLSSSFDNTLSISVMEHIPPEKGGDFIALEEIKRVLKPSGKLTISIPLKENPRIIYMRGTVYERKGKREFFAREYGLDEIRNLANRLNLKIERIDFIIERKGAFALDYWRWGNGRKNPARFFLLGFLKFIEGIGLYLEGKLANRYLLSSNNPQKGVVCAVLKLKRGENEF